MGGLFGGGGSAAPAPPVVPQKSKQEIEAENRRKREAEERRKNYGQNIQFSPENMLAGDSTLSSGSLLSLGGKLGG